MSRYFFSIRYDDHVIPDQEGVELADGADLQRCALYLAGRLQAEGGTAPASYEQCVIEVADANRDTILTLPVPLP
jgi:hypothetical protein